MCDVRRDSNWYLSKGEPIEVVSYDRGLRQLRVRCPLLKGDQYATIDEEETYVDLSGDGHSARTKLWGIPVKYSDIMTVYSGQGSQFDNVHVHAGRFKGKRNLLYTATTRAIKKLKLSGIAVDDSGHDLLEKMELHPKSVLWQARLGATCFSTERLAAAELEVQKEVARVRDACDAGATRPSP